MPGTNAYNEPQGPAVYEENIKRSVFIANLEPCHNEEEARDFLARISSQHKKANHHCRAYILGPEDLREYSSDDGEPSGTAGRPILLAIKHSGLVNVMITVTRYFGGVKLGPRGLIDAYGGAAAKVLELAGAVERVITRTLRISHEYNCMGLITRLLENSGALSTEWEYTANVKACAKIPVNACEKLSHELDELMARKIITSWEITNT